MDGTQRILGETMGIRLDHIGIAVNDLESDSVFWNILGLEIQGDELNEEQGVNIRFFGTEPSSEGARIELLSPTSEDTPIGKFLQQRGPGIQQIAFRVDDLQGLLNRLKSEGVRLINETPTVGAHGSQIAFVHPSSTGGVLVELLQCDD